MQQLHGSGFPIVLLVLSLVARSYLNLCNAMDGNLPGSSVHGILQARILEWVAIPFSRGSSQPRNQTCVSCIADGKILYHLSHYILQTAPLQGETEAALPWRVPPAVTTVPLLSHLVWCPHLTQDCFSLMKIILLCINTAESCFISNTEKGS